MTSARLISCSRYNVRIIGSKGSQEISPAWAGVDESDMIKLCTAETNRDEVGTERTIRCLGPRGCVNTAISRGFRFDPVQLPLERSGIHGERQLMSKMDAIEARIYRCENRKEGGWYEGRNRFWFQPGRSHWIGWWYLWTAIGQV